jgi:hypothetical protein
MFPPIENCVVFRASFPDGGYESVVPASEMASGVRALQFEWVQRIANPPRGWKLTASALRAWESLYVGVVTATRTTADGKTVDLLKEKQPRTIAGLPFTITDGDGAIMYLVID